MKRLILTAMAVLTVLAAKADEGMWLPSLIGQRIADMQEKGFRLNADDIYNINEASLKDAIVLFGRGCTGELISAEGLLLTNHHCGYSQIQQHSSVEHDYLRDGFWAMSREEELPNKGLTVKFLERMEDVTEVILKGYSKEMSEKERTELVRTNSKALIEEVTAAGNGFKAIVEALYYGNQYFLFVYREYSDIRLVGAPPSSIGKFGGDTDNWMWPRHTGDFSIFRIYADKDNNPAAYSTENVPYKPKRFFNISAKGVQEGEFTFIYGFPGKTQEYIHSEAVRYIEQIGDPHKIALRTIRLDIMAKHQAQSQKVRIQYSSKHANVANAWKKWQGEVKGLKKMKTVAVKKEFEQNFDKWAKGGEFDGIVGRLDSLYKAYESYSFANDYFNETVKTIELPALAVHIAGLFEDDGSFNSDKAANIAEKFFKDYYLPIDKECFAALMKEYDNNVPEEFKPEYFKKQLRKFKTAEAWAEHMFTKTMFANPDKVAAINAKDAKKVMKDPAVVFYSEFFEWFYAEVRPHLLRLNAEIELTYRDYMRGQMVYSRTQRIAKDFYPDANLTLRVAYGHVKGYSPADGIYYKPYSTMKGIIEKDNPDIFDYNIPQTFRDLYEARDFGPWTDETGFVPVCFLASNHTTGGNSGSPVINADGELIGINFDRVWEGTMSDLVYDPEICRNIALDVRYILFTIDKIAGAGHLIDEMVICR